MFPQLDPNYFYWNIYKFIKPKLAGECKTNLNICFLSIQNQSINTTDLMELPSHSIQVLHSFYPRFVIILLLGQLHVPTNWCLMLCKYGNTLIKILSNHSLNNYMNKCFKYLPNYYYIHCHYLCTFKQKMRLHVKYIL